MMKKLSLFAVLAVVVLPAVADTNWGTRAGSSADLSSAPATRTRQNVNYEKYQTRTLTKTYESKDAGDLYYIKPQNRSALYKQYEGANSSSARAMKTTSRTSRSEQFTSRMKRKYYLAHPFFQPLQGKFGSITDVSYTDTGYDITLPNTNSGIYDSAGTALSFNGVTGSWDASTVIVKEDFSYGITDRIALVAMAQYDKSDYEFKWDDGAPSDKMDDDGLNLFGIGGQWRFVDNTEWIGTVAAYYQHQKDTSNNLLLELKGGYKVSRSTIYALARGWYLDFDGDIYGNGVSGKDANGYDSVLLLAYGDEGDTMYLEAGLGVFSVLNEDWTLNVEGVFGDYDWFNQATIKGAIGWQPNDWFALNLYARASIYSGADGKELDTYFWRADSYLDDAGEEPLTGLWPIGKTEIDKYSEYSIGAQVIFQF
ncbi:MAG: hypothetical protein R8M37_04535 [Alphaproteobacteria bacterium]|nr:hypothetical protein [Alphaproteobacteria bacterium]